MGERAGQGTIKAPRSAQSARPTEGAKQTQPQDKKQHTEARKAEQDSRALEEAERRAFRLPPKDALEMWRDYRIFKAAGVLSAWREKWAGMMRPSLRPTQQGPSL